MLKALVFDFDGVIVDSEPLHYQAFVMVGRGLGFTFDYQQYLEEFIGFDDRDAFRVMISSLADAAGEPEPADIDEKIAALCAQKQDVFEALVKAGASAIPGVLNLIDQAAAEIPIAICSGATRLDIELMLEGLGYRDRFDIIVTADDVEHSKPDPASYALAAEKLAAKHPELGLTPDVCLAIEDTAAGLESATRAGLQTLGITTTGPAELLQRASRVHDGEGLEGVTLEKLREWFG